MSLGSEAVVTSLNKGRSRVTNGRSMFVERGTDERSPIARRLRDLVRLHIEDISPAGPEHLSQAQQQLIRRVAMIETQLEAQEGRMIAGDKTVCLEEFTRVSSALRRMYESLGLRKTKRDETPSLDELIAKHRAAKPVERAKPLAATPAAPEPISPLRDPSPLASAPLALDEEAVA